MSYDGLEDKDLDLKFRMMKLLWNLGWFVRPNVKLYEYQEGTRTKNEFTDIDVLAIKTLPLQDPITAICSAKSGKESDSSQIFWLSGVKSYFGASFAYYIRTKASLMRTKLLCEKLRVITLNEKQLSILEKRFSVNPQSTQMFNLKTYKQIHNHFNELKTKKNSLHNYITEKFWIDPANNQLLRIITAMKDVRNIELNSECKIFMKYYLTALLALPLFQISQLLIRIPSDRIGGELETALMGGDIARVEKEGILRANKTFFKKLVKNTKISKKIAVNTDSLFDGLFRLNYLKEITDLMINLVEYYNYSIYLPRMLDGLVYQLALKPNSIPNIQYVSLPDLPADQWKYVAKLVKDILIFIQRIGVFERGEIKI